MTFRGQHLSGPKGFMGQYILLCMDTQHQFGFVISILNPFILKGLKVYFLGLIEYILVMCNATTLSVLQLINSFQI